MLPITKEQFLEGLVDFLDRYKRLPYLPEDDVIVKTKDSKNEIEDKTYRANRYINEYYGSHDNMIKELMDKDTVSLKVLSDMTGFSETVIQNLITKNVKIPDIRLRAAIHLILGKDFYRKELGEYEKTYCNRCTKRKQCGQDYWITVVSCSKFKQSKRK